MSTDCNTLVDNRRAGVCPKCGHRYNRPPQIRGSRNPNAKLTEEKVAQMRLRWLQGAEPRELVQEFGVSGSCVSKIISERTWTHVAWPEVNKQKEFEAQIAAGEMVAVTIVRGTDKAANQGRDRLEGAA